MTIPLWLLFLVLGTAAWLAGKKLCGFLAYTPEDPGRYETWRRLVEALVLRTWNYLGVAGPNGRPLRLALVGAKYAEYLHWLHGNLQRPHPEVVALLKQEKESWPACWNLAPIPVNQLNPSSVDAVLLMPYIDSWAIRRELRKRHGNDLTILDFNRLTQFAIHYGAATEKNSPLFCQALEQYVRATWNWLGLSGINGTPLRLAIFGAGAHTQWLADITATGATPQPKLTAILDDRAVAAPAGWAIPVIKPEDLNPSDVDAILLSSDTTTEAMRSCCLRLFGNRVRTIDLYEALPPGPYAKL